ncbi:MAG: hypothetical protein KBT68_03720 [bacterium]|nr:hypothetical protein [Candidatus Colisoma equi]
MKRGSALLIVLGMVSFMVISAVAFSAYMRYSRLPSSYLRRTSSSRHLVKAALAEAIDQIDVAIGDNPHPGFGTRTSMYPRENGWTCERNYWRDRCFIGTNQLLEAESTVSVLNLEALAYLPPSLVNEARYYARHSATATWQDLGYDSGRFAFFAVDVSDALNVNRIPADYGRNSSDQGKFTLAFAFEEPASHSSYTVQPSVWDAFFRDANAVDFQKFRDDMFDGKAHTDTARMPFVSLADLNLAAYSKAGPLAQYVSPFCNYLMNGVDFVTSETGPAAEIMRALNVITDGYQQSIATKDSQDGNLADPRQQPFTRIYSGQQQPSNKEILQLAGTGTGRLIEENMSALDMISLYDYLDENDIPASLALPTVERVPMICGLQPALRLTFQPTKTEGPEQQLAPASDTSGGKYRRTDTFRLKVNCTGALGAMWMFPFRHDKDANRNGFMAEHALRICLAVEGPGLRTRSNSGYVVQQAGDFTASGVAGSVMRPKVTGQSLSFNEVDTPSDAIQKKDSPVNFSDVTGWFDGQDLFSTTHEYEKDTDGNIKPETDVIVDATANPQYHPVNPDGTGDGGFTTDLLKQRGAVTVRPFMTVTSRVTHNGKTVDLVPASCLDDQKYNAVNSDLNICNIGGGGATTQPIMTFAGEDGKTISFGEAGFDNQPVEIMIQPAGAMSVYCPDPRWNFAPENFVKSSQALSQSVYEPDGNCGVDKDDRDCDIFMFVSNQGYMQSPSELSFLPRTAVDIGGGNKLTGDCVFSFDKTDFETENGGNLSKLPHGNLMWRTYRLFKHGNLGHDGLYDLGLFDGGRGPRINPYTDSQYSVLAALANTPYSWWAASTNNADKALEELDAQAFNRDYAFSAMNNTAKFDWEDLKNVAANLQSAMRANADGDWVTGWENLDWDGDEEHFCGVQLQGDTCNLYDVDRKFLYGYWRDCFAAKQQLFLVFVRAEPMMMGGGQIGQTPPQLGARVVALVWRNPAAGSAGSIVGGNLDLVKDFAPKSGNAPSGNSDPKAPHRTRVLFYRQFE